MKCAPMLTACCAWLAPLQLLCCTHVHTHSSGFHQSSWFESGRFDLSDFDAFELRVRGDGRRFITNLQAPGMARRDDLWQCFMFTRGGPEWENIRVSGVRVCLQ